MSQYAYVLHNLSHQFFEKTKADRTVPDNNDRFAAALRVIIPQDGSAPKLSGEDAADLNLYELIGWQANALRLKPFQRQRVSRVAHRMKNFGYSKQSITFEYTMIDGVNDSPEAARQRRA